MKRLISLILVLAMLLSNGSPILTVAFAEEDPVVASGDCGEGVTWTLYQSGLMTISGEGAMDDDVPWYAYEDSIVSVCIEDGITHIGDGTFNAVANLQTVTIGRDVKTIGESAFWFSNALSRITVDENNPYFCSDESGVLFNKDKTTLILAPRTYAGHYEIPETVTRIETKAFCDCASLTSVTIPDSVTELGGYAFAYCYALTGLSLPSGITEIPNGLLCDSTGITQDVVIPDGVITLGSEAFLGCGGSIYVPASVTYVDQYVFANYYSGAVYFLGDAPEFNEYAFDGAKCVAYYSADNTTWTEDVLQDYGGYVDWVATEIEVPTEPTEAPTEATEETVEPTEAPTEPTEETQPEQEVFWEKTLTLAQGETYEETITIEEDGYYSLICCISGSTDYFDCDIEYTNGYNLTDGRAIDIAGELYGHAYYLTAGTYNIVVTNNFTEKTRQMKIVETTPVSSLSLTCDTPVVEWDGSTCYVSVGRELLPEDSYTRITWSLESDVLTISSRGNSSCTLSVSGIGTGVLTATDDFGHTETITIEVVEPSEDATEATEETEPEYISLTLDETMTVAHNSDRYYSFTAPYEGWYYLKTPAVIGESEVDYLRIGGCHVERTDEENRVFYGYFKLAAGETIVLNMFNYGNEMGADYQVSLHKAASPTGVEFECSEYTLYAPDESWVDNTYHFLNYTLLPYGSWADVEFEPVSDYFQISDSGSGYVRLSALQAGKEDLRVVLDGQELGTCRVNVLGSVPEMTLGESYTASYPSMSSCTFYSYTPDESGWYVFTTADESGYLAFESQEYVESENISASGYNYTLMYMEAGTTYRVKVINPYDSPREDTFTFGKKAEVPNIWLDCKELTCEPGTSGTYYLNLMVDPGYLQPDGVDWTSTNPDVAEVIESDTGYCCIYVSGMGEAEVTATAYFGKNIVTATCRVVVENYPEVKLNQAQAITLDNSSEYFTFIPEQTGFYTFTSSRCDGFRFYFSLYNGSDYVQEENNWWTHNKSAYTIYYLEAGSTYRVNVYPSDWVSVIDGSFTISTTPAVEDFRFNQEVYNAYLVEGSEQQYYYVNFGTSPEGAASMLSWSITGDENVVEVHSSNMNSCCLKLLGTGTVTLTGTTPDGKVSRSVQVNVGSAQALAVGGSVTMDLGIGERRAFVLSPAESGFYTFTLGAVENKHLSFWLYDMEGYENGYTKCGSVEDFSYGTRWIDEGVPFILVVENNQNVAINSTVSLFATPEPTALYVEQSEKTVAWNGTEELRFDVELISEPVYAYGDVTIEFEKENVLYCEYPQWYNSFKVLSHDSTQVTFKCGNVSTTMTVNVTTTPEFTGDEYMALESGEEKTFLYTAPQTGYIHFYTENVDWCYYYIQMQDSEGNWLDKGYRTNETERVHTFYVEQGQTYTMKVRNDYSARTARVWTVAAIAPESMSIANSNYSIWWNEGDEYYSGLDARFTGDDGFEKVIWSCDNEDVIEITWQGLNSCGYRVVGKGTANITAVTESGKYSDSVTLYVPEIVEMTEGIAEELSAEIGVSALAAFTPAETGLYYFDSYYVDGNRFSVQVNDAQDNWIDWENTYYFDSFYRVTYQLTAGESYRVRLNNYSGAALTAPVRISMERAEVLTLGQAGQASIVPGGNQAFLFTPETTGYYYFYTPQVLIDNSYMSGGYLNISDLSGTCVNTGTNESQEVLIRLDAGNTYRIELCNSHPYALETTLTVEQAGTPQRVYLASDSITVYKDAGTQWVQILTSPANTAADYTITFDGQDEILNMVQGPAPNMVGLIPYAVGYTTMTVTDPATGNSTSCKITVEEIPELTLGAAAVTVPLEVNQSKPFNLTVAGEGWFDFITGHVAINNGNDYVTAMVSVCASGETGAILDTWDVYKSDGYHYYYKLAEGTYQVTVTNYRDVAIDPTFRAVSCPAVTGITTSQSEYVQSWNQSAYVDIPIPYSFAPTGAFDVISYEIADESVVRWTEHNYTNQVIYLRVCGIGETTLKLTAGNGVTTTIPIKVTGPESIQLGFSQENTWTGDGDWFYSFTPTEDGYYTFTLPVGYVDEFMSHYPMHMNLYGGDGNFVNMEIENDYSKCERYFTAELKKDTTYNLWILNNYSHVDISGTFSLAKTPAPEAVNIYTNAATMWVGPVRETEYFNYSVEPMAAKGEFTVTSSAPGVVEVVESGDGYFTLSGVSEGTATVTLRYSETVYDTVDITVKTRPTLTGLNVGGNAPMGLVGDQIYLVFNPVPANAGAYLELEIADPDIAQLNSMEGENVCSLDLKKVGTTTLTVTDQYTGVTKTVEINVVEPKVIQEGFTETVDTNRREVLAYQFTPETSGRYVVGIHDPDWYGANFQGCSVDGEYCNTVQITNGKTYQYFVSLTAGVTYNFKVTPMSSADSLYTVSVNKAAEPTAIFMTQSEYTYHYNPDNYYNTLGLSAEFAPADAIGELTWSISGDPVAEIWYYYDNYVILRFTGTGDVTVTAKSGDNLVTSATVHVLPMTEAESFEIMSWSNLMIPGQYVEMELVAEPAGAAVNPDVTLSDTSVAQISTAGTNYISLHLIAPGQTTVTVQDMNTGVSANYELVVHEPKTIETGFYGDVWLDAKDGIYWSYTPTESGYYMITTENSQGNLEVMATDYRGSYVYGNTASYGDDTTYTFFHLAAGESYYLGVLNHADEGVNTYLTFSQAQGVTGFQLVEESVIVSCLEDWYYVAQALFTPEDSSERITWSVSEPGVIEIVSGSGSFCNYRTVGVGTVTLTATTISGYTDSMTIQVVEPGVLTLDEEQALTVEDNTMTGFLFTAEESGRYVFWTDAGGIACQESQDYSVVQDGEGEAVFVELEAGETCKLQVYNYTGEDRTGTIQTMTAAETVESAYLYASEVFDGQYLMAAPIFEPINSKDPVVEWTVEGPVGLEVVEESDYQAFFKATRSGEWTIMAETASGDILSAVVMLQSACEDEHVVTSIEGVEATCTTSGWTAGSVCEVCGEILTARRYLPAPGHRFSDWTETVAPTWQSEGEEVRTCSACDLVEKRAVSKLLDLDRDDVVTRGILCAYLWHQAGAPEPGEVEHTFTDVTESYPYYKAVLWAYSQGIVAGMSGETFGVNYDVTRAVAAVFLYRTAGAPEISGEVNPYQDVSSSTYYYTAVIWAYETGHPIATSRGETIFVPDDLCVYGDLVAAGSESCEHSYESVVTAPTCTDFGFTTHTCTLCGHSYVNSEVEALGHDLVWTGNDATCTTPCYKEWSCTRCDYFGTTESPALGHSFTNYVSDGNGTCTTVGTKTAKCDRCDVTDTVDDGEFAPGHTYESHIIPPTCTEQGYTSYICSVCEDSYTDGYTEATGHSFGEWEIVTDASCVEAGSRHRTCQSCGAEEIEQIPALSHDMVHNPAVDATCTEDGQVEHWYCNNCFYFFKDAEGETQLGHVDLWIPATGHIPGEEAQEDYIPSTCTKNGSYVRVISCSGCGMGLSRESVILELEAHSYENGYCSACGAKDESYFTGDCGENVTWHYDDESFTLTISGEGRMNDYESSADAPWGKFHGTSSETPVTSVVIEEGVTSVAAHMLDWFGTVTSVELPESLMEIGAQAFYYCDLTEIRIPAAVQSIGAGALGGNKFTSVVIPEGVTELGDEMFVYCSALEYVDLPESLQVLGNSAFAYCEALTDVQIPDGVTTIGHYAFEGCTALQEITFPESMVMLGESPLMSSAVKTVWFRGVAPELGGALFGTRELTVYYPTRDSSWTDEFMEAAGTNLTWVAYCVDGAHTEVIDPEMLPSCTETGLTEGSHCSDCHEILNAQDVIPALDHNHASIITPPTCTEQGYTTFKCTRCDDVYEGDYVEALGHNMTYVEQTLPSCVKPGNRECWICNICGLYFADADGITEVQRSELDLPAEGHKPVTLEKVEATCTSTGLTEGSECSVCGEPLVEQEIIAMIPHTPGEAVQENYVDATCTVTGSYDSVISCTVCGTELSRETVTVELKAHSYENGYCSTCGAKDESYFTGSCGENLTWHFDDTNGTLTISGTGAMVDQPKNDATSWGKFSNIQKVVMEEGITYIGARAFLQVETLEDVEIPSTVTSIGDQAFLLCTSLTSVEIPESVTSIGVGAFMLCSSLSKADLPAGLLELGSQAFWKSALTEVVIPANITVIPDEVFREVTTLERVTFLGDVTKIGLSAFAECNSLRDVTLPNTLEYIDTLAFENCTSLTEITIPETVTEIANLAFDGCTALANIWFRGNAPTLGDEALGTGETTVYYPTRDGSWTDEFMAAAGENLTWVAYCVDGAHTEVIDPEVLPSCTESGMTEGSHCSDCHEILKQQEYIGALGHDLTHVPEALPSCYVAGYKEYWVCESCTAFFTDSEGENEVAFDELVIPSEGHSPVFVEKVEPTCAEEGMEAHWYCAACENYFNDEACTAEIERDTLVIPELDTHKEEDLKVTEHQDPTCTVEGYTLIQCQLCNEQIKTVISATGHSYESVVTAPTCTEQGYTTHTCTSGDDSYVDSYVDPLGHTAVDQPRVEPTCTEVGYTEGQYCSVCNEILLAQQEIEPLGHSFTNYVSEGNFTCTVDGTKTAKCDRCDVTDTVTDTGSAPGHKLTEVLGYAATCTEDGKLTHWHCSVCGRDYLDDSCTKAVTDPVIDAPGHKLVDETEKEPTYSSFGVKAHSECENCGQLFDTEGNETTMSQLLIPVKEYVLDEIKTPEYMAIGETAVVEVSVDGKNAYTAGVNLDWEVDNEDVLAVTYVGGAFRITAKAEGSATISVANGDDVVYKTIVVDPYFSIDPTVKHVVAAGEVREFRYTATEDGMHVFYTSGAECYDDVAPNIFAENQYDPENLYPIGVRNVVDTDAAFAVEMVKGQTYIIHVRNRSEFPLTYFLHAEVATASIDYLYAVMDTNYGVYGNVTPFHVFYEPLNAYPDFELVMEEEPHYENTKVVEYDPDTSRITFCYPGFVRVSARSLTTGEEYNNWDLYTDLPTGENEEKTATFPGGTWTFDGSVLGVYSDEAIYDFESPEEAPWYGFGPYVAYLRIGGNLNSIGNYAFCNLDIYEMDPIGETVERIGYCAFANCERLSRVEFWGDPFMEENAFYGCNDVQFQCGMDAWRVQDYAVCNGIDYYTAGDSYYHWDDGDFISDWGWGIDPDGFLDIWGEGDMFFEEPIAVYYSRSVQRVVSTAPWSDYSQQITGINIGSGITSIADTAFAGLNKVEEIIIPETVQSVGSNAFATGSATLTLKVAEGGNEQAVTEAAKDTGATVKTIPTSGEGWEIKDTKLILTARTTEWAEHYSKVITTVHLGKDVTGITAEDFAGCTKLNDFTVEGDTYTAVNGQLIENGTLIIAAPYRTEIVLDKQVTAVAGNAIKSGVNVYKSCDSELEGYDVKHSAAFVEAQAATCDKTGRPAHYHCSVCGGNFKNAGCTEVQENVVLPIQHGTATKVAAVKATCTEDGIVEHWTCLLCKKTFEDENCTKVLDSVVDPAIGHEMTAHAAKRATCTEDGSLAYWSCSNCSKFFAHADGHDIEVKEADMVRAKLTHVWLDATCDAPETCKLCGATQGEAQGHSWKDATCTEPKTCQRCGDIEGTALNHSYGEIGEVTWSETEQAFTASRVCGTCQDVDTRVYQVTDEEVILEPTCTEDGTTKYTAAAHGGLKAVAEVTTAKLGHNEKTHAAQEPTCTEIGWDDYVTCSRCDYTTYVEKEALGHKEVNHTAKAPTCTEIGWDDYVTCERCDYTTYVEKEALGHKEVNHAAKAPTCTEIGWDAYVTCNRCDYTTYAEKKELGHTEVTIPGVPATETQTGLTEGVKCSTCGEILKAQEIIDVLAPSHTHSYQATVTAPTCTEGGYTTYTCSCGASYTADETKAKGHTEVVDEAVEPTCSAAGKTEGKHCSDCAAVLVAQEEVEKLAHTWSLWTVNTAPTATTEGQRTRKCQVCGETETEILGTLSGKFEDVADNQYYALPVDWAVQKGVTTGMTETTFAPKAECTRAQIVTFLWRAAGSPEPTSSNNPFTDVPSDAWYAKAVLWAVEKGITTGMSATTFEPGTVCTRAQVATFLWRAQGEPEPAGTGEAFTDVPDNAWYAKAVKWAVENGVTNGAGVGIFAPSANCTRGQIVTFLYRAMA